MEYIDNNSKLDKIDYITNQLKKHLGKSMKTIVLLAFILC